jgi:hypothetical protein
MRRLFVKANDNIEQSIRKDILERQKHCIEKCGVNPLQGIEKLITVPKNFKTLPNLLWMCNIEITNQLFNREARKCALRIVKN